MFVPFRRKREGRTNYKKRLALLKSGKLRVVVRNSLKNVWLQIVEYHDDGDKVLMTVHSRELKKFGWTGYLRNLPAAYLTGLLCGLKAKKAGLNGLVLDAGLKKLFRGNLTYSALKGIVDSGLDVAHGEGIFPSDERIQGKHISDNVAKNFNEVKDKITKGAQ